MSDQSARFLDLPVPTRVALTERAIAERKTQPNLWVAFETPPDWDDRAALVAEFLNGHRAIADLGAGYMHLERFLPRGVSYYPVDVSPRDDRTVVCDFNASPVPRTGARAAACLGLIEYICDPGAFLSDIAQKYDMCALTYNVLKNPQDEEEIQVRRGWGWMHDYDLAAFERLLSRSWEITQRRACSASQFAWQLKAKKHSLPLRSMRRLVRFLSSRA